MKNNIFWMVMAGVMMVAGCKKDKNEDKPTDLELTNEKGSYFPLEIAQLNVLGGKIGNDTLQGEFNQQKVIVYAFDSAIVFVVPDVAAGDYTLKVSALGKTLESPVTVNALTGVQSPETYIQKYAVEVAANVAYIKAKADSISNTAEAATLRSDADKLTAYMNDMNTQFQALSLSEKADFARFMEANKTVLDELHQAILQMQNDASIASRSGVEDHERNIENLMESYTESVKATVKGIPKLIVAVGVVYTCPSLGPLCPLAGLAAGFWIGSFVSNMLTTVAVMQKLITTSFVPFQNFTVNNVNYSSGTKTALNAELTYRSVFSTDIQNKVNSVISKSVSIYQTFNDAFDFVMDKIPASLKPSSVIKSLSSINTYLSKKRLVFGSYFNIKNISNPKITLQQQKNADGTTEVTFTTTEITKQNFTYDIEYNNIKFASDVKATINATVTPLNSDVDVYVAGENSGIAKYWKNGVSTDLAGGGTDAYAKSIVVSNGDVYVAGGGRSGTYFIAKYWKNGSVVNLTNGSTTSHAYSIKVQGNDIYVAGQTYNTRVYAKCWKNGISYNLENLSYFEYVKGMDLLGTDVYIVGYSDTATMCCGYPSFAAYWRNGVKTQLSNYNKSIANSISVSGNDVYILGSNGTSGYWKNETFISLGFSVVTEDIKVVGNDIYIVGNEGSNAKYWKNGVEFLLGSGKANSIFVLDGDVYVAGTIGTTAVFWKNGVATTLGSGSANSIYVVKK